VQQAVAALLLLWGKTHSAPALNPGLFFAWHLTKTPWNFYKIFGRNTFGYKWTVFDKFTESRCGTVFMRQAGGDAKKGMWGVGGVRNGAKQGLSTPFENVLAYNRGIE